jgi:hypothetical protein
MKLRILLFMILLPVTGCVKVEVCNDDKDSLMVARFKTMKEDVPADTTVKVFSLYGIREGMPDSLIYDSLATTNTFEVPLDPHQDVSRFVMHIGDASDTLVVSHHREIYMVSYKCGFATLFTIDQIGYSTGMIKSYEIRKAMVDAETEKNEEHIWLYL